MFLENIENFRTSSFLIQVRMKERIILIDLFPTNREFLQCYRRSTHLQQQPTNEVMRTIKLATMSLRFAWQLEIFAKPMVLSSETQARIYRQCIEDELLRKSGEVNAKEQEQLQQAQSVLVCIFFVPSLESGYPAAGLVFSKLRRMYPSIIMARLCSLVAPRRWMSIRRRLCNTEFKNKQVCSVNTHWVECTWKLQLKAQQRTSEKPTVDESAYNVQICPYPYNLHKTYIMHVLLLVSIKIYSF